MGIKKVLNFNFSTMDVNLEEQKVTFGYWMLIIVIKKVWLWDDGT
jgi:hypothetical protein